MTFKLRGLKKCFKRRRLMILMALCVVTGGFLTMPQLLASPVIENIVNRNLPWPALQSPDLPTINSVLLVTYGRSGSTFTSYILKEAADTFFFYEPLRPLLLRHTNGSDIIMSYRMIGGKVTSPEEFQQSDLTRYESDAVRTVDDILNCDFTRYPVTDYKSIHFLWHGETANLSRCLWTMNKNKATNLSKYLQCLFLFWAKCRSTKQQLLKVIRLPLRVVPSLLHSHPHLALVYLARDPRAILVSQKRLFHHAPTPEDFCDMVQDDISHFKLLKQRFPQRAFLLRYEAISASPLESTQHLFQALRFNFTSEVAERVSNMTSAPKGKEEPYNSFRSDPTKAANKWRMNVDYAVVEKTDELCGKVYKMLGYNSVENETLLRNLNISLFIPTEHLPYNYILT